MGVGRARLVAGEPGWAPGWWRGNRDGRWPGAAGGGGTGMGVGRARLVAGEPGRQAGAAERAWVKWPTSRATAATADTTPDTAIVWAKAVAKACEASAIVA